VTLQFGISGVYRASDSLDATPSLVSFLFSGTSVFDHSFPSNSQSIAHSSVIKTSLSFDPSGHVAHSLPHLSLKFGGSLQMDYSSHFVGTSKFEGLSSFLGSSFLSGSSPFTGSPGFALSLTFIGSVVFPGTSVFTKSDLLKNRILADGDSSNDGNQGGGFSSLLFLPAGLALLFLIAAVVAIARCRKKGGGAAKAAEEEDVTEPESTTVELDDMEHDYTNPLGDGSNQLSDSLDDMVLSDKSGNADEML
jgi:hypothetical protein